MNPDTSHDPASSSSRSEGAASAGPEQVTSAPVAAAPDNPGLWRQLRDAIRGTDADYTRIPLKRAILLLAVPMVLELVMESTFAVVDIFFIASLGASAVATVGITETFLALL